MSVCCISNLIQVRSLYICSNSLSCTNNMCVQIVNGVHTVIATYVKILRCHDGVQLSRSAMDISLKYIFSKIIIAILMSM